MRGNAGGEGTTESPVREEEGPTHLTELITAPKQNVVVAVAVVVAAAAVAGALIDARTQLSAA